MLLKLFDKDMDGPLVLWNILTNQTTTLVSSATVGLVSASATFVAFGEDKSLLLFYDDKKSVWRHSFIAEYIVLDTNTNEAIKIVPEGKPEGNVFLFCFPNFFFVKFLVYSK